MSLVRRVISVTFRLQSGNFAGTGSNTLTVTGLKTWFTMSQVGGVSRDAVHLVVFGLTQSQMNQLSTYGMPPDQNFNNEVTVQAGDAVSGMATVFQGTITSADANYGPPEASLVVRAYLGQYISVAPAASLSYRGTADAATIMGNIAQKMGLTLENSGVNVKLSNPYFSGSLFDQAKSCARAGNFYAVLDGKNNVLAIWPKGQNRNGSVLTISPQSGLVGYPEFTLKGVVFTAVWNPNIIFGRAVKLISSLQAATGMWVPMQIDTNLQSETPDGAWFMQITAYSTEVLPSQ